jgi:DNA-binding NarL/FixJ family response regulator
MGKDQTTSCRIRVLVQHAEPLLALGLAAALDGPAFEVRLTPGRVESRPFDVLVSDPQRGMHVLADQCARSSRNSACVLIVAVTLNEAEIHAALRLGAHGYVLLNGGASRLKEIVSGLVRGERYVCPLVARHLATGLSYQALTERELEVLRLLVQGDSNKAIGNSLAITAGTVKAHVRSVMAKLRVKTRTEAASLAMERGLVPCRAVAEHGKSTTRGERELSSAPGLFQMAEAGIALRRDADLRARS